MNSRETVIQNKMPRVPTLSSHVDVSKKISYCVILLLYQKETKIL